MDAENAGVEVKAKALLSFCAKAAGSVVALWGGYLLVGVLRGEYASVANVAMGTVVVLGIILGGLCIYGHEAPWLPWRYRRWKKERENAQARHHAG